MSWFSSKKTIGKNIDEKVRAGRGEGGRGSATKVQNRKAKDRGQRIKDDEKKRKQDEKDVRRAKLLAFSPPSPADSTKFKAKAIKKGDKRRQKKSQRKARRKARGFFG